MPQCARGADVRSRADTLAVAVLSAAIILLSGGTTLLATLGWIIMVAWHSSAGRAPVSRLVVLGMKLERSGVIGRDYRTRLDRAAALWRQVPAAEIILLGGCSRPGMPSEAAAGAAYLVAGGVPRAALFLEECSRHTLENLCFYRVMTEGGIAGRPTSPGPAAASRDRTNRAAAASGALIVTNRFHLGRSSLLAHSLGISHRLCAAEPRRRAAFAHPLRLATEMMLTHWYMTCWLHSKLTGSRRMRTQPG